MRMPPVALEALGAALAASAAVAVWIWWVAIDGGTRRAIITHSDEFLHHGARALLMYPWAPVFGRGYVLVAIVCLVAARALPRPAADRRGAAGAAGAAARCRAEHGRAGRQRNGAVPPLLAGAAVAGCACGGVRASWPGCWVGSAGSRVALLLALVLDYLREQAHFWRQPTSIVVVAAAGRRWSSRCSRGRGGWSSRGRGGCLAAGRRGDAGAGDAWRLARDRRGPGGAAPSRPLHDLADGADARRMGAVPQDARSAAGGDGRGASPVRAAGLRQRVRGGAAGGAVAGRAEGGHAGTPRAG